MIRFIAKRLLLLPPLLLGVSLAVFLLLRLGDNDPALSALRLSGTPPTEEAVAAARAELGLDRPLAAQYLAWLGRAARLDFGRSYATGAPVLEQLLRYLPNTLYLGGAALLLTVALGVPLGMAAAVRRNRWPDTLGRALACFGVSMPSFWLGFAMIVFFSVKLRWLPATGMGAGPGGWRHLLMPAASVALMPLCVTMRLVRAGMVGETHGRHILYARLRGVTERRILFRHVLRNALIPVVTTLGMHVGEILGGAVVAEVVFAWPGIGRHAVSAVMNRDFPVMQCFILMMTAVFVLCNLAADILYALIDPRIRLEGGAGGHAHA